MDPVLLIQLLPGLLQMFAGMRCLEQPNSPKNLNLGNGAHGCSNRRMLGSLRVRGSYPPQESDIPKSR